MMELIRPVKLILFSLTNVMILFCNKYQSNKRNINRRNIIIQKLGKKEYDEYLNVKHKIYFSIFIQYLKYNRLCNLNR